MVQQVSILSRFVRIAAQHPERPALWFDGGSMTYGRLLARAGGISEALQAFGPSPTIGIVATRGAELVAAMLGISMAGGAFVVFDAAYPEARLRQLITQAGPQCLIWASDREDLAPAMIADPDLPVLTASEIAPSETPPEQRPVGQVAYHLFTSGTTGAPKQIAVGHAPLVHFVDWCEAEFGLSAQDRFTMFSGLSHDPILRDVFLPLSLGASLHIPRQSIILDAKALGDWWNQANPTVIHLTPQLGGLLAANRHIPSAEDLRIACFGGDRLQGRDVDAFSRFAPRAELVNYYGATETPQAICYYRVPKNSRRPALPIGQPVDGFTLSLRKDDGALAGPGETGELWVESDYLSLGYVRDGVITPHGQDGRTYRTGDYASQDANGLFTVVGRQDDQIKIRGYRVDLNEIAAHLGALDGVDGAVVLNVGSPDLPEIAGFVTLKADRTPDSLMRDLSARVPAYMTLDQLRILEALPLSPNGKVNRAALKALADSPVEGEDSPAIEDETVAALVSQWRKLMPRARVTPQASFASLDGDSLNYVMVNLATEEIVGPLPHDWVERSIIDLAAARPATQGRKGLFGVIESGIFARAVAIVMVVATHFGLVSGNFSITTGLIFVSGHLFGQLQLAEVTRRKSVRPIVNLILSLAAVLVTYTLLIGLLAVLKHRPLALNVIFMVNDLVDFSRIPDADEFAWSINNYYLWYIHGLVHTIIFIAAFCWLLIRLPERRWALAWWSLFAVLCLARFVPALWEVLSTGQSPLTLGSRFRILPTTTGATFLLGALVAIYGKGRELIMSGVIFAYALCSTAIFGWGDSISLLAAGLLVTNIRQVPIPRIFSRVIYMIAGASLFIYLFHYYTGHWQVNLVLRLLGGSVDWEQKFGGPILQVAALIASVTTCVVLWLAWNFASGRISQFARRLRPA